MSDVESLGDALSLPLASAEAFEDLYARTREPMRRLAFVLIGEPHVAEELVQDVFARLYRRRRAIANVDAYLRSAVINACRNHQRTAILTSMQAATPDEAVLFVPAEDASTAGVVASGACATFHPIFDTQGRYVVQKGDNLLLIAACLDIDLRDLIDANANPGGLRPGDTLVVPTTAQLGS